MHEARKRSDARDDELIVMIAGTSWDGTWHSERHVAMHLAKRRRVLWVDPQMSLLTPLRDRSTMKALRDERLRDVAPNIVRLTPVTVPGVSRPVLRDIAVRQARRSVRRAVRRLGASVHTTIVASLNDMLDVVPAQKRVFYGTDDFVAGARLMGTNAAWMETLERRQLELADLVIAISPELKEKWSAHHDAIAVIGNGCDAEHFARADEVPPPADISLPKPIAGFVGHMSDRIDIAMLEAVADTGASLLLVGPRQPTFEIGKLDALIARPNVSWVGAKHFTELPAYLGAIHVGLTPYRQSAFNHASMPLKTLEYLAAGRPVVASDLPAHHALDTEHVSIAGTVQEFAERTVAQLARSSDPGAVAERRALGMEHSWSARTEDIARLLGIDDAGPSIADRVPASVSPSTS
jgi:teichuronic acid biosynthesis glycosyltransferase TuaH